MKPETVLTVYLRADQCASLLRLLEKGEAVPSLEADVISSEIRLAVFRKEGEERASSLFLGKPKP
jgi:hypothetical protein